MGRLLLLVLAIVSIRSNAQTANDSIAINPRYFEDQFYLGITYNFILNQPEGLSQQNLSYGLQGGFVKDIPLNYNRTIGIGIGLGLGLNTYYSNLGAIKDMGTIEYEIISDDVSYKRSKIETHSIELPIEFRWRNSTATEYKFWRMYTGIKFAYLYGSRSKFVSSEVINSFSNPDTRKLQYGLTFNFGYNSFNAHVYYSLTHLFNDAILLNQENIKIKPLRIGLVFYIL